ncbi:MAG: radical SAM protein [Magnetospirillum sp.]|nr:radical SAM protein [Magnetospirillum sp.]
MPRSRAPASTSESDARIRAAFARLPQPEYVPDRGTYEREIALRLSHDPRCRANYERYLASDRREVEPDFLPIRLDIENVSRCNFRCSMCQVSEWPKGRRAGDMTLDEFKRLIDEQYGLIEIKLHGMGEPLLGGDVFHAMVRYARERHIWVRTVSNASLLHLKDNARKIIDSGINELQISIDACDKETFETISKGAVYERVMENCRLVNRYCDSLGVVRTKMWTVVQKTNYPQLFNLVEHAADLGFKTQVFSLDLTSWGQDKWRARNDAVSVGSGFDFDLAERMVERGRELGVRVAFWAMAAAYDASSPRTLCPWPFERAYVASDLRVVPCCIVGNPDVLEIGQGRADSFTGRWTGREYAAFRQAHRDGDIPDKCRWCYKSGRGGP